MPVFNGVSIEEAKPKTRYVGPSQREIVRTRYKEVLEEFIVNKGMALEVVLEEGDIYSTVRNRIKWAVRDLGLENVVIRRKGSAIYTYQLEKE